MGQEMIGVATLAAAAATVLSVSCTWPQLARIRRTGDVAGVSISAAALTVASELGWTLYLGGAGLWSAVPEGVFNIVANAVLVIAVVRCGGAVGAALTVAMCWAAVLFGARWLGGPATLAALLALAYAVQLTPAVVSAWRTWSPSGVAAATWTLRMIESLLWAGYGQLRSDPPLILFGALGAGASTAILVRKRRTRFRPPALAAAGGPSQLLDDAMVG